MNELPKKSKMNCLKIVKSVADLKKLKDIFEICMILIDDAVANEDLELGYESAFQFERRIRKFKGDVYGYC